MRNIQTTFLTACLVLAAARAGADGFTPFQISVLNPAQIVGEDRDVHGIRITILSGVNRDLNGIDVGPIGMNIVEGRMIGIQAGGLVNSAERGSIGIQAAMGVNLTAISVGLQVAGVGNNAAAMNGMQVASVFNTSENCNGLQVGLANRATALNGIQVGFIGLVEGDMNGIQLTASPFLASPESVCSVGKTMRGLQAGVTCESEHLVGLQAGALVNYSTTCAGTQVGLVNIADTVRGMQIGLVNYCNDMSGVQIGLVNVISDNPVPFIPVLNMGF